MRKGQSQISAIYQQLRAQPRNLLAIGLLISIVSLGPASGRLPVTAGANADSKALISLYADGQQRLISSDDKTVGDVLRRAGIKVGPTDLVEPALPSVVPHGQFNINVYRSRPVLVQDGLRTYRLWSAYQSPRLLALAAGLVVYPEDNFRTEVITDLVGNGAVGEKVLVDRALPVIVKVDGTIHNLRTQSHTVADALEKGGVTLGASDTISVSPSAGVTSGMTISITRVTQAVVTLTQILPRAVKTILDPKVLKGQSTVLDPGADGQKTVTWRVHYKDGVETSREMMQLVSETKPTTKVVSEGSKVLFAGSVEYWRPMVEAAAAKWALDPNMMLRIMTCESHGNATAVNSIPVGPAHEHATGLFQFLPSTWRSVGGTDANILDGAIQIQLAAKKMAAEGTSAWQCK